MGHEQEGSRRNFLKGAAAAVLPALATDLDLSVARAAERAGHIRTRKLGRTGLRVTMIGIGGHHAGNPESEEESIRIIQRGVDLGINFFDNADCYQEGNGERRMGKALEGRRKEVILMTKVDQRDAKGSREQLEKSLHNLRTDYLDLWQFHDVRRIADLDKIFGPGGAMETAEKARQQGLIRFIGITGHYDPAVLLGAIKRYAFDTVQMPINALDPHFKSFRTIVLDEAVKRNVGVIGMKTLAQGRMVSMGVVKAEEGLRYALSQPIGVLCSGCDRLDVLDYNVYVAKTFKPLTEAEQAALLARTKPRAGTDVEYYKGEA